MEYTDIRYSDITTVFDSAGVPELEMGDGCLPNALLRESVSCIT